MIFESASFSSQLKLFQFQEPWRAHVIEKLSRRENGSPRMASSDVLFWNSEVLEPQSRMIAILLTKDWMTGFWTRNWWNLLESRLDLRKILENNCLRLKSVVKFLWFSSRTYCTYQCQWVTWPGVTILIAETRDTTFFLIQWSQPWPEMLGFVSFPIVHEFHLRWPTVPGSWASFGLPIKYDWSNMDTLM